MSVHGEPRAYLPTPEPYFALSKDGTYWFLQRVVAWAVVRRTAAQCEVLVPVGTNGVVLEPEACAVEHIWTVHAEDVSPSGLAWREVFHQAAASQEVIGLRLVNVSSIIPTDFAPAP